MNAVPKIVFLAGVSGAGKTTMMQLLLEDERFEKICSVTTRKPRDGEISGDQYIFTNTGEFEYLIEQKKFLEYAYVHQIAYYGTRLDLIQQALDHGKYLVKTIDMIGMEVIEQKWKIEGQYISFFIDISEKIMKERILMRQPDMNNIELQHRLDSASMERNIANRLKNCIIIDGSGSIDEVFSTIKNYIV
jgi:guanylate kinase